MEKSDAYKQFLEQLEATGRKKMDGYHPKLLELIDKEEREQVEDIIYHTFVEKSDGDLAIFMPKLEGYDGIEALKQKLDQSAIPNNNSINISFVLWDTTEDTKYLDIVMENYNKAEYEIMKIRIVGQLSYCKRNIEIYKLLVKLYINSNNSTVRSGAVTGILYNKGYLNDLNDFKQKKDILPLARKFIIDNKEDRKVIIEKF